MSKGRGGLDPALSEAIIGPIREPMIVLSEDLRVIIASPSFYKTFRTAPPETSNFFFYELGDGQWDIPELRNLLERVISQKETVEAFEVTHDFKDVGKRTMLIDAREIIYDNDIRKMLVSIYDITDRRKIEKDKEKLMKEKVTLLKAGTVKSEESRIHLEDAHERILSIATVQRNLDPTGDDAEVPVVDYLTALCASLTKSMIGGRKPR